MAIPGLDVFEITPERIEVAPDGTAQRQRPQINTTINDNTAAREAAIRARNRANSVPGVPSPETGLGGNRSPGMLRNVGSALRSAGPAVAGAAGAAAVGAADKFLSPETVVNQGPFPAGNNVAPGQIPGANPQDVAPPAMERSFFRDTDAGRNIGNILNASVGLGGVANTMRAGSGMARALTLGGDAVKGATAANVMRPEPKVAVPPVPPVSAAYRDEGRNYPTMTGTQGVPEAKRDGVIYKNGNSYSGNNVDVGADIMENGKVRDGRGGYVFPLGGGNGGRGGLGGANQPKAEPMGGVVGIKDAGYGLLDPQRLARRELEMATTSTKSRLEGSGGYNARIGGAVQALNQFDEANQKRPVEMMREKTLRDANDQNNATARYMNDQNAEVSIRGQDVNARNARLTARSAAAKDQRDQFESDRRYQLDLAKYGGEVAEKNRLAAEGQQKANQTRLENTFRKRDGDGKDVPDTKMIGQYNSAVDATIPRMVEELVAMGTPEALKKAKEINERGQAAFTPADHDKFSTFFKTREQARSAESMFPGGAEFVDSNNLLNYRQKAGDAGIDKRMLTPNRVVYEGGTSMTPNDLRYEGGANRIAPDWFKTATPDLYNGIRRE